MTKAIALTSWKSDKDQVEAEHAEALGLLEETNDLVVETQDDLEFAASALAEVKGNIKMLKERRDRAVEPIKVALREIQSWFVPVLRAFEGCEKTIKHVISEAHVSIYAQQRETLDEAAQLSMGGDMKGAEEVLARAATQEFAPVKGLSLKHTWDYEIYDFEQVPREHLLVDDRGVKAIIREHEGDVIIPGIKPIRITSVASASTKR